MRSQRELVLSIWTWGILVLSASAGRGLPPTDLSVLGPVYMPAAHFNFPAFITAKKQVIAEIEASLSNGNSIYGPTDNQTTSFSVQVFGVQSDEPLLDYHFEAPGLVGSTTKRPLSENTVYRAGSLGKLMTIYVWMVDIGDKVFLDPITNYVVGSPPSHHIRCDESNHGHSLSSSRLLGHMKTLCGLQTGLK